VPQEWPAIPGHHGDIGDEMVKRPQVLCHVGLSSLLTDGWIRLNPRDHGVRTVSYPPSRVISGKIVCGMVCIVIGFHLPSWDGR
jgi:hypothetical protein